MTPLSIFSHNILQCSLGTNEDGPIVQLATFHDVGQLDAFNFLLAKYWQIVNAGNLQQPPSNLLGSLEAEWRTFLCVAAHYAYSPHLPFSPSQFSSAITQPNLWLGQSYYRIRRLLSPDIPRGDVVSSILLVAHYEAAGAEFALKAAAETLKDPIVLNNEILEHNSPEYSHETI